MSVNQEWWLLDEGKPIAPFLAFKLATCGAVDAGATILVCGECGLFRQHDRPHLHGKRYGRAATWFSSMRRSNARRLRASYTRAQLTSRLLVNCTHGKG